MCIWFGLYWVLQCIFFLRSLYYKLVKFILKVQFSSKKKRKRKKKDKKTCRAAVPDRLDHCSARGGGTTATLHTRWQPANTWKHNFISFNNISKSSRYSYGRTHLGPETTPQNRKCTPCYTHQRRDVIKALIKTNKSPRGVKGKYFVTRHKGIVAYPGPEDEPEEEAKVSKSNAVCSEGA